MSGIVSGITKVFTTVGTAVARVGRAVLGVGATTFTAGAASGAGSMASGGLSGIISRFTGGGVLGNVLTGALTQAGYGALIGGAASALTGGSFAKGALMGAAGGALSGGLMGAAGLNADPLTRGFGMPTGGNVPGVTSGVTSGATPSGAMPTGVSAQAPTTVPTTTGAGSSGMSGGWAAANGMGSTIPAVAQAAAPAALSGGGLFSGGLGQFINSPMGGNLISGLGQGLAGYMASRERNDAAEADRNFVRERDQRITDSYNIDPTAYHQPVAADTGRPTPASQYARRRYVYDREQGMIVMREG